VCRGNRLERALRRQPPASGTDGADSRHRRRFHLRLQLATAAGARVIITSSSDAKLEQAKRLGAHDGINYVAHEQWQHDVMRLTGGAGADRVLETGGAGTLQRSLASVRREGSVQLIGVLTQGQIDPMVVLGRSIVLRGISVGSRDMFEALNRAITISELAPVVDRTFAFADSRRRIATSSPRSTWARS